MNRKINIDILIKKTSWMVDLGLSPNEIRSILIESGVPDDIAYLIYKAATVKGQN